MNRIQEMINSMCPEGVEKVPLWEITAWDKKFNAVDKSMQKKIIKYNYFLAKELDDLVDDSGDIRILYTTEDIAYTTEEKADGKISEGEVVAIPWGGNPTVKYYNGRFVTGDNRIATSLDKSRLDNKYLYYWMLGQLDVISTYYRGAGIKHPSMFSVLTMEIPLPPFSIQQEIISVLDTFTTLIDKMKQEVEARKKQMEYYREKLLTFVEGECEWKTLGEIAEIGTGSGNTNEGLEEGLYPFYTRGQEVLRKNTFEFDEEAIITAGDGVGVGKVMHYVNGKYALHQRAYRFRPNEGLLTKYLYYYMKISFYKYVCGNAVASSVSSLRKPKLLAYPIPTVPLTKQSSIVSTLDKFESYITKLEKMITLRQKQYEYYREKLLTFE